jgi:hypothetical protein
MTAPLSRGEILSLPPTMNLPTLGRCLDGLSEPVVRELHRSGRLAELGIKVEKLGARYVVITASVLAFLGLDGAADGANSEYPRPGLARQRHPSATALRSVSGDEAG